MTSIIVVLGMVGRVVCSDKEYSLYKIVLACQWTGINNFLSMKRRLSLKKMLFNLVSTEAVPKNAHRPSDLSVDYNRVSSTLV